jgi:tyrosyl-tRNA synthetase
MDINEKISLIKEVGEEIITEEDLKTLLETKKHPIAYDGFEPSGKIHVAQGLLRAININKMIKAGFTFKMFVADWHAAANNKFDGDLEKIKVVGQYFIEVWKACGLDTEKVDFVWASELVKDPKYWEIVLNISRVNSVQRVIRCSQIMGRGEDNLQASQILYPCMQAADIFYLKADATQLGMDQRKVNMLAREVGEKIGYYKPVVISHHMLMGLLEPPKDAKDATERAIAMKMSKSKPDSAIFMDDSEEDIKRKISKAYCPQAQANENPIMEYCKYIIFEKFDKIEINRPEKFGGNMEIKSYEELEKIYTENKLHPMDLKNAVAKKIDELIDPVRKHFENNKHAKELLEKVKSYQVTR